MAAPRQRGLSADDCADMLAKIDAYQEREEGYRQVIRDLRAKLAARQVLATPLDERSAFDEQ